MENKQNCSYEDTKVIAEHIQGKTTYRPSIGIICGSGLGTLVDLVENPFELSYTEIPGFPKSTVPGHEGKLVFGVLNGKEVVLMKGRAHAYEGYSAQKITFPVRVMHLMGIKTLFVTNAAGGINREFNVGDIMLIKDHLNLAGVSGMNPLVGINDERFGPRFPPMSNAYDLHLRSLAWSKAKEQGIAKFVREGVYCMTTGPNYETVSESRMLKIIGVDAAGMSTVPEVLVARHCGMRVLGMSLITNRCVMEHDSAATANHQEVLSAAQSRRADLQGLVHAIVGEIDV